MGVLIQQFGGGGGGGGGGGLTQTIIDRTDSDVVIVDDTVSPIANFAIGFLRNTKIGNLCLLEFGITIGPLELDSTAFDIQPIVPFFPADNGGAIFGFSTVNGGNIGFGYLPMNLSISGMDLSFTKFDQVSTWVIGNVFSFTGFLSYTTS